MNDIILFYKAFCLSGHCFLVSAGGKNGMKNRAYFNGILILPPESKAEVKDIKQVDVK